MQQEHKLSPSLRESQSHWGSVMCSSMATLKAIWSSGKISHTKTPTPSSHGRAPWAVFASQLILVSLMCWVGSEAGCRASGTQNYPPCPLQHLPMEGIDAPALQSASPPEPWGKPQTSRWTCPFFGLWGTWRESPVLPPPHHTHQMYLPLPHSFTLENANTLLTWVAEKWAIKRNTWENRRDSTKIKEHVFSLPGWPSYLTNWQRYSNDEAGKQRGCQQQFHKGCSSVLCYLS